MVGFLGLPLEVRNHVYDILLREELEPQICAVMVVSENYLRDRIPLRCYRGLLRACRQTHHELKQAIQHMVAAKQLDYQLDITFSHGRPYFSMTWMRFPGLSATLNAIIVNVDLRVREPFYHKQQFQSPQHHELDFLVGYLPNSLAEQLFDYIAILLKTLANLLSHGDPDFNLLYTEKLVLNFRTPTTVVSGLDNPFAVKRRVNIDPEEASDLDETMRNTLRATVKAFGAFDACGCWELSPLIQIGSLKFATEGVIWGEGHNMILAHDDFQWLQY